MRSSESFSVGSIRVSVSASVSTTKRTPVGATDDYIIDGPKSIHDNWPSLKQAGFKTVDAALPNPSKHDEAYIFSGDQYALIKVKTGKQPASISASSLMYQWRELRI